MKNIFLALLIILPLPAAAAQPENPWHIESVTLEGGPIMSKHFQSGDNNFRERHMLGIIKVDTSGYGNWGLYYLGPNSVREESFGAGYITNPFVLPLWGAAQLELTGALGLVTGYQDYPVPLLAGNARISLYRQDGWDAGVAIAALPYITEDPVTDDNEAGIVVTSPFLSLKRSF